MKDTRFKQTEIGEIPEDWEITELGSTVEFIRNGTTANQNENSGTTPKRVTRIETISDAQVNLSKTGLIKSFEGLEKFRLRRGDILFSHINSVQHIGKVALFDSDEELYHGMNLFLIRPSIRIDSSFLFYVLSSYRAKKYYEARCKQAVNQASLNKDEVSSLKLAKPSLPEQQQITAVLSCINSAVQQTDEVIEKSRALKKGMLQKLFKNGIPFFSIYYEKILRAVLLCRKELATNERNLNSHLRQELETVLVRGLGDGFEADNDLVKKTGEYPDIVIHKRGINDNNLLAIEVKIGSTKNEAKEDIEKLERLMLGEYKYQTGLFLDYDSIRRFEELPTKKVNIILVRRDGIVESRLVDDNRGYKKTEIGEIPEGWDLVSLSDVAEDFITGGTPSTSNPSYWNGSIHWTRSASITKRLVDKGENFISELGLQNSATAVVPRGNVLIATRVSIGNVGLNTIDVAISQDLTGIVLNKKKVIPGFIYWSLLAAHERILALVQGSTIQGLSQKDLRRFNIAIPKNLQEQERIDNALCIIDAKIESEIEKRSELELLKKGLMQDLLTGKVRFPEFVKVN